ncbi:transketolase [bacterium]|nr:transketolase [bacterium]|tara:strand:+ start:784 stop:1761 length:978 start_codon:yes stop_codon:yes gene_type:complete
MLHESLDPNILTDDAEVAHTRDGFGRGLVAAGEDNPQVVALCADLTESTRTHLFAEQFPERFVQVGVAEQNMASVASGMAAMGKVPFIASYAMFSPGRSWEQVRTTIGYNEANVKIIGAHAGVSVGPDGATHQAIEDIALMRVVPGMTVLAPVDIHEAERMVRWAATYEGPVYIRIGREKTPVATKRESTFEPGKALPAYTVDEATVTLLSTGTVLGSVLRAAVSLNEQGVATNVYHFASVKPLDTAALDTIAAASQLIVTIEEHQVAGGFGSAVAEYVAANEPTKVVRLGVQDQYGQSGTPAELLAHYGIDADTIIGTVTTHHA